MAPGAGASLPVKTGPCQNVDLTPGDHPTLACCVGTKSLVSRAVRVLWQTVMPGLVAASVVSRPVPTVAHDVPTDIRYQVLVKPDGRRLGVIVRAPLKAIVEVDFPKRDAGYLDIARADDAMREAATVWIAGKVDVYEEGSRVTESRVGAIRISLPTDRSFESYERALANVRSAPLSPDTQLLWDQGLLDVWLDYPIQSDQSRFSFHPGFGRLGLRVLTVLRFMPPGDDVRTFVVHDDPGVFTLNPGWGQTARRFAREGFVHALLGSDQLLFLFCILIPIRRPVRLAPTIAAFAVACQMMLFASAYNLVPEGLWLPSLVDALIAISLLYMAFENIGGFGLDRRWMMGFGFGLLYSFAASTALRDNLQFAGSHLPTSFLSFGVGIGSGQLVALALIAGGLAVFFRPGIPERAGAIVLSAFVAHASWHWTIERVERLTYLPRARLDFLELAALLRWLIGMALVAGVVWLARAFVWRWRRERELL